MGELSRLVLGLTFLAMLGCVEELPTKYSKGDVVCTEVWGTEVFISDVQNRGYPYGVRYVMVFPNGETLTTTSDFLKECG